MYLMHLVANVHGRRHGTTPASVFYDNDGIFAVRSKNDFQRS
jgi:hypothetical protein